MNAVTLLDRPGERVRRFHGAQPVRGLESVQQSVLYEGRFGRIFRNLPPFEPDDPDLLRLAETMIAPELGEGEEEPEENDNPDIPAGFTYLGQFIDHDITFDPNSKLQRENDPNALRNFRTPRLDLDSLYGAGPADSPFLYRPGGIQLLIGKNAAGEEDLPRNAPEERVPRRALTGDPRNDENMIVSQLHLAFLKFHNNVVETLAPDFSGDELFDEARRVVRWHYQWAVVHDFLRKVAGDELVDDILKVDHFAVETADGPQDIAVPKVELKFFHWRNQPFIPVEFSVAAYRFGHSMVRLDYKLNPDLDEIPLFSPEDEPAPPGDLRGFRERPAERVINWRLFFRFPDGDIEPQPSRRIDTELSRGLGTLPIDVAAPIRSLAARNLLRGKALGLATGQAVARAMGIPEELILTGDDLGIEDAELAEKFGESTPLWFYILREAAVRSNGARLGPIGGRVVAEVLIGLLHGDPFSYLSVQPNWRPEPGQFGARADGTFGMAELLTFAATPVPHLGPTFAELEADNPNIRHQYDQWRELRTLRGEDPIDYQAFRRHLIAIGAPDPGVETIADFPRT